MSDIPRSPVYAPVTRQTRDYGDAQGMPYELRARRPFVTPDFANQPRRDAPRQDWVFSTPYTLLARAPFSPSVQIQPARQVAPQDWVFSTPLVLLPVVVPPPPFLPTSHLQNRPYKPEVPQDWVFPTPLVLLPGIVGVDIFRSPIILKPLVDPPRQDWVWSSPIYQLVPPIPPTPDDQGATPGRVIYGRLQDIYARRGRTETVEPPDLKPYQERSRKIADAIARLKGEESTLRAESEALRLRILELEAQKRAKNIARQLAKLRQALLLKDQALRLAMAQEAMLLEEMEVIDIAYFAYLALAMTLQ